MAGAAFGSFVSGLFDGVQIKHGWEDRKRRQRIEDEDYEFQRKERKHLHSERERALRLRAEEEELNRKAAEAASLAVASAAKQGSVATPFVDPGSAVPTKRPVRRPPAGGVQAPTSRALPEASGAPLTFGSRVAPATPRDLGLGRPDSAPPPAVLPGTDPALAARVEAINNELAAIDALQADPRATTPQQRADALVRKAQLESERDVISDKADAAGGGVDIQPQPRPRDIELSFGDLSARKPEQPDAAAAAAANPAAPEAAKTGVAALTAPEAPRADGTTAGAAPSQAAPAGAAPAATPAVQAMGQTMISGTQKGGQPTKATKSDALESFMDAYVTKSVPMLVEGYIRLGQHDKAMAFAEFARSEKAKKPMKMWARAVQSAMMGNEDGTLDALSEYYNTFDDGYSIIREKSGFARGPDGQVAGINLVFRDDKTGKTFKQFVEGGVGLLEQGVLSMSPEKMFDRMYEQVTAGQKAAYGAAEDALRHERAIEMAGVRGGGTNPRQAAAEFLAKENPRFLQMSPEEQEAAITQWLTLVSGAGAAGAGPAEPPMARTIN